MPKGKKRRKKIFYNKQFGFRASEEVFTIVYESIKYRANKNFGKKSESVAEYLRNLIVEEWERNRQDLKEFIKNKQ